MTAVRGTDVEHDPQGESEPPRRGFGWGATARRNDHKPERSSGTPGDRNDDLAAERSDAGPERNAAGAGERPDRSGAGLPATRDGAVAVPAGRSGAVLPGRAGEVVEEWAGGLRPWNLPLGSPRELVVFAKTAPINLGHIDWVRAANVVFVRFIAVPVIMIASFIQWAFFVQLHRAVTAWFITLVLAHFLNRLVDGWVPDWLDMMTWSATTWQWIAGGLAAFAVATALMLARGRRR